MNLIKLLLIVAALMLFWIYIIRFRSLIFDRSLVLALFFLGVLFIVWPTLTTNIAHLLGVGRGTDLILYIFIVAVTYCLILLYSKVAKNAENQTEVVRELAILLAQKKKG